MIIFDNPNGRDKFFTMLDMMWVLVASFYTLTDTLTGNTLNLIIDLPWLGWNLWKLWRWYKFWRDKDDDDDDQGGKHIPVWQSFAIGPA